MFRLRNFSIPTNGWNNTPSVETSNSSDVPNTISLGNNQNGISSNKTNVAIVAPPPPPPPPTNYILNLTNCLTIWSGTNPSSVQKFIWNPTGDQSQSTNGPGIPNLIPNPKFISTAGKGGNSWISSGFTLAKGEFIGNSDGSLYLIMNSDGNLNLCSTNYSYYSGIKLPSGNYGGGPNSNAIYQLSETGQPSLLNNIYYIDADSNAHLYPIQNVSQSNSYTKFPSVNTGGNDLGPIYNSSVEECQKVCNNNSNCAGFVFSPPPNNICFPKSKSMWPYTNNLQFMPSNWNWTFDTYVKMNQINNPPSGITSSTNNIDSYIAKNYVQSQNPPNNSYGVLDQISGDLKLISNLESQIESLANQLIKSNVKLANSQKEVYKQSIKDKKALDDFFKDYKSIQNQIENVDTQNKILADKDILVLQENYKYLLWTSLAIGIVVITINVFKKSR